MESLRITEIIKKLAIKDIPLFTLNELGGILGSDNKQTIYKRTQRLIKDNILKQIINGKYIFTMKNTHDFTISNFLYRPSYISMQSALSFYSIITGFAYEITGITIKKTKKVETTEKEFSYSKIDSSLFWGYEKIDNFLIARPEKALLDYIYFSTKGITKLDWDEIDTTRLDKKLLLKWAKKYNKLVIKEIKKHI